MKIVTTTKMSGRANRYDIKKAADRIAAIAQGALDSSRDITISFEANFKSNGSYVNDKVSATVRVSE